MTNFRKAYEFISDKQAQKEYNGKIEKQLNKHSEIFKEGEKYSI